MENKQQILPQPKLADTPAPEVGCKVPCASEPDANLSSDLAFNRSIDTDRCRECVGALAHRMAQPMTALRGGIELGLMGKRTVADYRALLEQSLHLADAMVQMIVSLRDLGESGASGGTLENVSLPVVIGEVLAEMETLAQSRDLHLELHAEGAFKVHADPEKLREALQSLLAWVINNSACGGPINVKMSAVEGMARVYISPPRLDLQYLQIKMLENITSPGLLFSQGHKLGSLGWVINRRLIEGFGGKLEMLPDAPATGSICVTLPLAPSG